MIKKKAKIMLLSALTLGSVMTTSYSGFVNAEVINSNGYEIDLEVPADKIATGVGPFDANDDPGYDSSEVNSIVRTNDDVLYNYKLTVNKPEVAGQNIKVEIKTVVNNAYYKNVRGVRFAAGNTVYDDNALTATNTEIIDAKAGTALAGVVPLTVTDKFKNGHQFNVDVYARVVDDSNQPLSDYVKVQTNNITVSSKMNFNVMSRAYRWNTAEQDLIKANKLITNLEGIENDITTQLTANQYIMIFSESFRPDKSIKGLYIEEGAKFNLRLEKTKQHVKYDDEPDWKRVDNSKLSYQVFGGNVYAGGINNDQPEGLLYTHSNLLNSFGTEFNYYTENNIPMKEDGKIPSNSPSVHQFPNGVRLKDNSFERNLDRNNKDNEIYWSGKFSPKGRDNATTIRAQVEGYEIGNNPVNEEYSRWDRRLNFEHELPISVHAVVTNLENKDFGIDAVDRRNNTVQTEFATYLDSYEIDGQTHPLNKRHDVAITVRNTFDGNLTHSTLWYDHLRNKAPGRQFSGHGFNDPYNAQKTYRGNNKISPVSTTVVRGKQFYLKHHLKWNPEVVTINDESAHAFDDVVGKNSQQVAANAMIASNEAILTKFPVTSETWKRRNIGKVYEIENTGFVYDFGIKKNRDYSKDSIFNATEDDYYWFSTYQEALDSGLGEVSSVRKENPNLKIEGYDYISAPIMTIDTPEDGNYTNGHLNIQASDVYYRESPDQQWTMNKRVDGVAAEWDKELNLINPEIPGSVPNNFTSVAIEPSSYRIWYHPTDTSPTSTITIPNSQEQHVAFKINGTITNSPDYREDQLEVSIDFPKGINYKTGSAYVINEKTGEKIYVEMISQDNNINTDRELRFKLPEVNHNTGQTFILHYDITLDEKLIEHENLRFKKEKQFASIYWSSFKVQDKRFTKEQYQTELKTAGFALNYNFVRKVSIIDDINKAYDEINSEHVVTVKPYTTLDVEETTLKGLTIIPTEGYHGTLKLKNVTSKNNSIAYRVFYTNSDLPSLNPKDLTTDMFTPYNGGEVEAKYVLFVYDNPMTVNTDQEIYLHMQTNGNQGGDRYAYRSTANTDTEYKLEIQSNTVETRIIERDLSGIFWHDKNRNGLIEDNEEKFNDKDIELYKDGQFVSRVKTNQNGEYLFSKLQVGTYEVRLKDFDNNKWEVTQLQNVDNGNKSILENDKVVVKNIVLTQNSGVDVDHYPFNNIGIYAESFKIEVVKKWARIDNDKTPEITIELLKNDQKVNEITLNRDNGYLGEFTDLPLDEKDQYTVKEVEIDGFDSKQTVENKQNSDDLKVTIVNSKVWKKLPSTGGNSYIYISASLIMIISGATLLIMRKKYTK